MVESAVCNGELVTSDKPDKSKEYEVSSKKGLGTRDWGLGRRQR